MAFGDHTIKIYPFFSLIIINLLFPVILAAGRCDCPITIGSSLSAGGNNPAWASPSGEFAFGFRPLPRSPIDNQDLFLLAIWYYKIPEQTIVWSKNDHPAPAGSAIHLTKQGLILYDSTANETWRSPTGNQTPTGAAMLDSGNFVLTAGDSNIIWDSFSYPTDTMLPGQKIGMGGNLTSRRSDTDYTDGRFMLAMQPDGNLVLYTLFLPSKDKARAYWASGTMRSNSDSRLIFDEAEGYIYIQQTNRTNSTVTKRELGSRQDVYYMARLDYDGVLRLYNRPRILNYAGSQTTTLWMSVQTIPEDICGLTGDLGSGACGYNSYCVNANGKPNCLCPQGYSLLDPYDKQRGCKPDFTMPSCNQDEFSNDFVEFQELNNTNWPMADYELQTVVDKDMCINICQRDCFCAAAIYNTNNQCWKKRFPLSNGRQSSTLNGTVALIKVVRRKSIAVVDPKRRQSIVIIISALLGSSVFLNILLLVAIAIAVFLGYHKNLRNLPNSTVNGIRVYSYKELEEATGGFKEHIGQGSFGTVYKGVLPSIPKRYIAIKRLDKVEKHSEKEFTTEVSAIGRTHHKNLVTLLGYCDEGSHRILVYEYMSNGSLASHVFGLSRPHWNQRMQIALGIARGLTYLHEECSTQIIHCDVKPQNILLDEYLTPKISDFGMAKLLLSEQSRAARTHIRGTIGYFAPEWFRKASITVKVDVYSFGAMLLEVICCMSSVEFGLGDEEEALIDWVYECYSKRKLDKLVENDEEAKRDMESVERLVKVGIWCIQEDPSLRPSMRRVTQMLEGVVPVSVPPTPSPFNSP